MLRKTTVIVGWTGLLLLAGCQTRPDVPVMPDARMRPTHMVEEANTASLKIVEVKVPITTPQLRPWPHTQTPPALTGAAAVSHAAAIATTQPSSGDFLNAIQFYDYAPGMVYSVLTSPGFVTTIALKPGEKLITAAAGDTARWIVDSVESGSGVSQQVFILIKPRKPFLKTNLLVTTDQRAYTLDLASTDQDVYHTMVAWHYPTDDMVSIRNKLAAAESPQQPPIAQGLDLAKMNFNYVILRNRHDAVPDWCPLRAFDDGQKTYIQFPPRIAVSEAPPLFVLGAKGDAQLVNYRIKGDYYIVDRLFDRAELRLGQKPQTVIAIQRAQVK
jgi:type IV secretion system protein VirB9